MLVPAVLSLLNGVGFELGLLRHRWPISQHLLKTLGCWGPSALLVGMFGHEVKSQVLVLMFLRLKSTWQSWGLQGLLLWCHLEWSRWQ